MAIVATLGVLRSTAPHPRTLAHALSHPQAYVDDVGADVATLTVAGALCWLAVAWLAVGLTLTVLSTTSGALGAMTDAVVSHLLPATMRHGVAVALGVGVGVGILTGTTSWADPVAPPAVTVEWPVQPAPVSVDWPASTPPAQASQPGAVVVARGDTLWAIAADRLDPDASAHDVAESVRRWFDTNRAVIGPNPDVIRPGQLLIPPSEPPPSDSTVERHP